MRLHHFGIAVDNMDEAIELYELLGFQREGNICPDEIRNINIQFMTNEQRRIELISWADKAEPSPVATYLSGRDKSRIYHSCYEVDDIEREADRLKSYGFVVIDPIKPAPALGNQNVCFLFNRQVGIIELLTKAS